MLAGRLARQFANTKNPASDTRRMPTCEDRFGRILGPFPPPASIVNSALAAAIAWAMFTSCCNGSVGYVHPMAFRVEARRSNQLCVCVGYMLDGPTAASASSRRPHCTACTP